jgi:hypothetical protein
MNPIAPVENTNVIRYADFVRITTGTTVYLFSTAPYAITIPSIDASPFAGLGSLVKVGTAQRDIKSTANETTLTIVGIDTAKLAWVLGANIKGSQVEMWHGFFDANNQLITSTSVEWVNNINLEVPWTNTTGDIVEWTSSTSGSGLYQFFNGYINSFSISEQYMEEARAYFGVITISASSIQLILQNRTAGRYTNNPSWTFWNSLDNSMNRVNYIQTINYQFGKTK